MADFSLHIIGAPQAGKSAVFDALTSTPQGPHFATRSGTRIGSVKVPDQRLAALRDMYNPKKYVPAEISFADLDSHQGDTKKAAATEFMSQADALVLVVQGFGEMDYDGNKVDTLGQFETFVIESTVTDMEKVERRFHRAEKEKFKGSMFSDAEKHLLEKCQKLLEAERPLREMEWSEDDRKLLAGYQFVSRKPIILVANVGEDGLDGAALKDLEEAAGKQGIEVLRFCATLEAEIAQLPLEEQQSFLQDYGLENPARDRLIQTAYRMMDLISFFTVGEDEVRAWTIRRGTNAQAAAGKIHSDIERGFIRAEVVPYDTLLEAGAMSKCRDAGTLRLEGKEYIVHDGEVVHYRFSV
ncbi:MAG: YchF family ATPase [Verrucomicrobia bacterium]|nr:YchF family ATPase [Verrucomicrobiota bacterium]